MGFFASMVLGAWKWDYVQSDKLGSLQEQAWCTPWMYQPPNYFPRIPYIKEFASRFSYCVQRISKSGNILEEL